MREAEVVAAIALALLAYTYFGYPVLVALLSRLWPLRVRDGAWEPMVTVCIPAHNAAGYAGPKIESLLAQDWPRERLEVLIYSDGSTDGTDEVIERYAARDPRVRLLRGGPRAGKPTALNRMRSEAGGEVLVLTDVRQPLERGAIRALVRRMSDPAVGCVSGNLRLRGQAGAGVYWRYENWIRASEAAFRGMVGATGPLYALRRVDLPAELPSDTILDDVWIPMRLRLQGRRLLFCEEAVAWDEAFADEREFGRKVRTLAGSYQLFARMPRLLLPLANPSWFETMSHKVARLLCPWALAAMAIASLVGAATGSRPLLALLAGQVLFYGLAAAGGRAGRAGALARTFVVLNGAAAVGLARWLSGSQRVTW